MYSGSVQSTVYFQLILVPCTFTYITINWDEDGGGGDEDNVGRNVLRNIVYITW